MATRDHRDDAARAGVAGSVDAPAAWLSVEETIAAVGAAGHEVSRPLLDRWQRAGLISPRRQWHHRDRPGSQSAYPADALPGIIALARLRPTHRRSLDNLAAAWLEGAPIPAGRVRAGLAAILRRATALPARAEALRRDVTTGALRDPFDAAEAIMALVPDVRALRDRLPAHEDRTTVATLALEWCSGGAPLWCSGRKVDSDRQTAASPLAAAPSLTAP